MSNQEPLYYRLTPVYPPTLGDAYLAAAAIVTCMATGRQLHHCGGGEGLAPEIVKALDRNENGGKARMIVSADLFDGMVATLNEFSAPGTNVSARVIEDARALVKRAQETSQ